MCRCLVVCGKCVRGITQVCSPLQITPRAVLRLKLRPPSVASAKQLRNQLRLHFQVSRLAPSGLNPPYFVLPPFLFVEFHFQRLRMHCRYQMLMIHARTEPSERKIRARICLKLPTWDAWVPDAAQHYWHIYQSNIDHSHLPCHLPCA